VRNTLPATRARSRHDADNAVHSYAILPIGWPMGRFGPLGRQAAKDVVYQDQWGKPYQGL
jgi:hypothetical protein